MEKQEYEKNWEEIKRLGVSKGDLLFRYNSEYCIALLAALAVNIPEEGDVNRELYISASYPICLSIVEKLETDDQKLGLLLRTTVKGLKQLFEEGEKQMLKLMQSIE